MAARLTPRKPSVKPYRKRKCITLAQGGNCMIRLHPLPLAFLLVLLSDPLSVEFGSMLIVPSGNRHMLHLGSIFLHDAHAVD
jgi:hypothetical protein